MKREGIIEIAKKFGVAPSTVSRAIHGNPRISCALKMKIMKYVREIGYKPPSPNRNVIGVAVSYLGATGYFPELLTALRIAISAYGLRLELIMPESLENLDFRIYKGIIAFLIDEQELTALCERAICPVVTINYLPEIGLSNYSVLSDEVAALSAAGDLLYHAGHRRIAMLLCELNRHYNNINRRRGYEEFCRKKSIPVLFFEADSLEEEIIRALDNVKKTGATGLIMHSTLDAFYLLHKAEMHVPEDISVVLHNDQIPIEKDPLFFMIVQDYERLAESALQIIESVDKDKHVCSPIYLPYRLYVGHSIMPAR